MKNDFFSFFIFNSTFFITMSWFSEWFDSPYYHVLYQNRNDEEAHFFIDNLIKKYEPKEDAKMLDLACGKGRHSIYLADKGYEVTGVDLSPQSIEHASGFSHDKLSFYIHDMRKPFRINYYDNIFSFFTSFGYFERASEHKAVLDGIRKGLKSGGRFVMDFMNANKVKSGLVLEEEKEVNGLTFYINRKVENGTIVKDIKFTDKGEAFAYQERVHGFELEEMKSLFQKSGLVIDEVFGNYDLSPFSASNSPRLIISARKDA